MGVVSHPEDVQTKGDANERLMSGSTILKRGALSCIGDKADA